jgi:hypothetical protein
VFVDWVGIIAGVLQPARAMARIENATANLRAFIYSEFNVSFYPLQTDLFIAFLYALIICGIP